MGSKKVVPALRSINNIVIAAASTGIASNNITAVIKVAHANRGRVIILTGPFIIKIVVIKLIAPIMEDTPAKCKEKIPNSIIPDSMLLIEKGGYIVHPAISPSEFNPVIISIIREGNINHNLILFIRGKAISAALTIMGISQLPKPPIIIGITIKKIIRKACMVT